MIEKIEVQNSSLIIPLNIEAICLNSKTDNNFSGAVYDFSRLQYDPANYNYSQQSNIYRLPGIEAEQGIHLHWALPEVFTHGVQDPDNKKMAFPKIPDRWLITRIFSENNKPLINTKSWLIESDFISMDDSLSQTSIPFDDPAKKIFYKLIGRSYEINGNKTNNEKVLYFRDVYNQELTALGYGETSFSGYYQNCRNVFGFYDPDIADSRNNYDNLVLSYQVTGWFSVQENNPLDPKSTFQWNYPITQGKIQPENILCSGLINNITWQTDNDYFPTPQQKPVLNLAVGNNGQEAFSCLLANLKDLKDEANPEYFLNAIQNGLLTKDNLNDWEINEKIHEKGFSSFYGGNIWSISYYDEDKSQQETGPNPYKNVDTIIKNLPENLADELNELNQLQRNFENSRKNIESSRKQIYLDWYKYIAKKQQYDQKLNIQGIDPDTDEMKNLSNLRDTIANSLASQVDNLNNLLRTAGDISYGKVNNSFIIIPSKDSDPGSQAVNLESKVNSLFTGVQNYNSNIVLKLSAAPRYWQPREPVLLFYGDEMNTVSRYSVNGDVSRQRYIPFRFSNDLKPELNVSLNGINFSFSQTDLDLVYLSALPAFTDIKNLITEAIIIDPNNSKTIADIILEKSIGQKPDHSQMLKALVDSQSNYLQGITLSWDDKTIPETFPVTYKSVKTQIIHKFNTKVLISLVFNDWSKSVFRPLFLSWSIKFLPVQEISKIEDKYTTDFITGNFTQNNYFTDFICKITPSTQEEEYTGTILLSPNSTVDLIGHINQYLSGNQDQELSDLTGKLNGLKLLSQSLSGFNQSLLMNEQFLQLNIVGLAPNEPLDINGIIQAVGKMNYFQPLPANSFNPMRAGYALIKELSFIDIFGRKKQVYSSDFNDAKKDYYDTKVSYSELMNPQEIDNMQYFYLPPRFSQPAALQFRWLSANGKYVEMNSHPITSPVCGWVVPNHFEGSLDFYTFQGNIIGSFQLGIKENKVFWVSEPAAGGKVIPDLLDKGSLKTYLGIQNINQYFQDFILSFFDKNADYLKGFITVLDATLNLVEPGNYNPDNPLELLVGRPLALVRAALNLELKGLPATNQSFDVFTAQTSSPTNNFENINIPVRLGDLKKTDDGLMGYFIENSNGADYTKFYSAAASINPVEGIVSPEENPLLLKANPIGPVLYLTMLVDPTAVVHATTGILPVKDISIPQDYFASAIKNISLDFMVNYVLSPQDQITLPLPEEKDFQWSWLEALNGKWIEDKNIKIPDLSKAFTVKEQRILEGWISLKGKN